MAKDILILAVGKMSNSPEKEMVDRYIKRMSTPVNIKEVNNDTVRDKECKKLLSHINSEDWVVALDLGGKQFSSEEFSDSLNNWMSQRQRVVFIIGGAEGLTKEVIDRSDTTFSFGKVTWPHMIVRVLVAEQLFRAQCISNNHPYHKDERP